MATGVSLVVDKREPASGMSLIETCQWLGLGPAIFAALSAREEAREAHNPFHAAQGAGHSDSFLALAVPFVLAFVLSLTLAGIGVRR